MSNDNKIESLYREIADDLKSERRKSVLILGPELLVDQRGRGYKAYFKELERNESLKIDTYFETDNLFSFSDGSGFGATRDAINQFYNEAGDTVLLEMIARLRFPLVINLCPDQALQNIFIKKGIPYDTGFFTCPKNQIFQRLDPSKDRPVIFNVFGTVDRPDTLIYTHSELYRRIEELLPKDSLPSIIESYLELANSFVFLGVRFDSWYYQLICHKLGLSKSTSRRNLGTEFKFQQDNTPPGKDNSAGDATIRAALRHKGFQSLSSVVSKSFGLVFTDENPATVVEKLIGFCGDNNNAVRAKDDFSSYSLFVSYSWRENDKTDTDITRQTPVDYTEQHPLLKNLPQLNFLRDKNVVGFGDNIMSFMTRIGKGKTVLRVISDRYLKSYFCMKESLLIEQYKDENKRVFNILWDDVDRNSIQTYIDHWRQKLETIAENIDDDRTVDYPQIFRFLKGFYNRIIAESNPVFGTADFTIDPATKTITINDSEKQKKMEGFIEQVVGKLKEN